MVARRPSSSLCACGCAVILLAAVPLTRAALDPGTAAGMTSAAVAWLGTLDADQRTRATKPFGDESRLRILALLRGGLYNVQETTQILNLAQPTVSHHLRILTDAGLLLRSQRGTWAWFTLQRDRLQELAAVLQAPAASNMGVTT